jgi:hypothetical protein
MISELRPLSERFRGDWLPERPQNFTASGGAERYHPNETAPNVCATL